MGYRDDFYKAENVIGYSGNLHDFPTVYFQTATEFGHITQRHDSPQNVGRMEVESAEGYQIGNAMVDGGLHLVELVGGKVIHVSRSVLTRMEQMSGNDKAVLFQAIWACPNEKPISSFSRKDFRVIGRVERRHANLMQELVRKGKWRAKPNRTGAPVGGAALGGHRNPPPFTPGATPAWARAGGAVLGGHRG